MTRVVLQSGLAACALSVAVTAASAQGQLGAAPSSSRAAQDRKVDEAPRQTQSLRQTEAPKAAADQKPAERSAPDTAKPAAGRQPEPHRQREPQRQRDPERQHEPGRQHDAQRPSTSGRNDNGRWSDPGPAWRPIGPAWHDLNDRPGIVRPGEDAFRPTPQTFAPRDGDRRSRDAQRKGDRRGREVYIVPYAIPLPYYEGAPAPYPDLVEPPPGEPRADERPLGFLQLRVSPRTADVAVDGAFAGTVDDFGGRGARMLSAGPHRVEISAPGYDTLTFDVRVPENDTVTFTRDLDPATDQPVAQPASVPHKTMYIVPMCFIGDRMPTPSDMPAGCRVEDVRVIP